MEWIKTDERLPNEKGHYLAISKMNWAHGGTWEDSDGDVRRNMCIVYFDSTGKFNHPYLTHWAPLPNPPIDID